MNPYGQKKDNSKPAPGKEVQFVEWEKKVAEERKRLNKLSGEERNLEIVAEQRRKNKNNPFALKSDPLKLRPGKVSQYMAWANDQELKRIANLPPEERELEYEYRKHLAVRMEWPT
jgi:hypothetical protein